MKSKRTAYILLPAVLLIWGLIAQRVWLATQPDKILNRPTTKRSRTAASTLGQRLPSLLLTYADPFQADAFVTTQPSQNFIKRNSARNRERTNPVFNLPVSPPIASTTTPVVWPEVTYLGSITNQHAGTEVVLLTIGSADVMLKAGESAQGIKIIRIFPDSVCLAFQRQRKTYARALHH